MPEKGKLWSSNHTLGWPRDDFPQPCIYFLKMKQFTLLYTLLSLILCADPPKRKPKGKKQLIPFHPFSLKTECGYVISFTKIFTKPGTYNAVFGDVPKGYAHTIGLLGLLSLSRAPIKKIYAILSEPEVNLFLNYPALNPAEVYNPDNPLITTLGEHFANPYNVTIQQCLSKKSSFKRVLKEYKPKMEPFLSRPFSKILAIAQLNSLPRPLNQNSNSSSSQNIDESPNQNSELLLTQNFEELESDFKMMDVLWILNDSRFLPFLLRLKHINSTEITLEVYSLYFSSSYNLAIESHSELIDAHFVLNSSLISLYHMYPEGFARFCEAYGISNISDFIEKYREELSEFSNSIKLFLKEFDEYAPLVILPYCPSGAKHTVVSTGNTMHLYQKGFDSSISMTIVNKILTFDKDRCPSYHIIRVFPNGKWESIADSIPHKEPATPGTIYAISFVPATYLLGQFLSPLSNNIELMADALEDYGFSVFAILPSNRNSK